MVENSSEFPARYEPLTRLGKGGGGEVWAARDRVTSQVVALKLLREAADEPEMLALVREATALSGVEGLGVPRVLHFGRLPESARAYMVRELVEGKSLADLLDDGQASEKLLAAVAQVADLLTRLHRALLLHGDIKPANIIVGPTGVATLVDLGLAAHWHEGGARPEGLTPRYAAPELFIGAPLTPRAEVFALGATLGEVLQRAGVSLSSDARRAAEEVVARATAAEANDRYPSADEFAEALRHAARLETHSAGPREEEREGRAWSIVGLDAAAAELIARIRDLAKSGGLVVTGPAGSGKSTLLRRAAWSLGVGGQAVALLEAGELGDFARALEVVTAGHEPHELLLIVDDADRRSRAELEQLDALRERGARLVLTVSANAAAALPGRTFALYPMQPLEAAAAAELVRRMIPSLSAALAQHIVARTGGLPGLIRAAVEQLGDAAVVSAEDVDRKLDAVPVPAGVLLPPAEIHRLLDRGRFDDAADRLAAYQADRSVAIAIARAKLATNRGDSHEALRQLAAAEAQLDAERRPAEVAAWHVQKARALLRGGDYGEAELQANLALGRLGGSLIGELAGGGARDDAARLATSVGALAADALAVCGLAQSYAGRHDESTTTLRRSVEVARSTGEPRGLAVALGSLAFALQRSDKLDEAELAHAEALVLAEQAGDAGHVATTRVNLAGIAKTRGDVAAAIAHLEAAVDMGRRSGRLSTMRQALLNLANLDLYIGRLARAQGSIDALANERDKLMQAQQAQLLALEAEHAALSGQLAAADEKCAACADAYQSLGRSVDAAEALLERVIVRVRGGKVAPAELQEELLHAQALLGDSGAHRSLLELARALLASLAGEREQAFDSVAAAIDAARSSGQRDWVCRALEQRAVLHEQSGAVAAAIKDRREALELCEQIASELPRDLREVYWNDARRRALKDPVRTTIVPSTLAAVGLDPHSDPEAPTQIGNIMREDRLSRVLAVNREIAGEYDLDRLLERVTEHAVELARAERGFVLLRSKSGEDRLSVHAARERDGSDPHARFSRSIAERVVETGEPFVAADALRDERVAGYLSVHSLMLKSVACVPIRARGHRVIGALYLETRLRPGASFRDELPTLSAFADQVAIAIDTARLINENRERARELEEANRELEAARQKLEESLDRRTEQLDKTRKSLRETRDVLRSHFGYKGIVGTSTAMRRVYAVVDRVKDTDVPVLLTGESGTGKEVIARAIHNAGPRTKGRFVGLNCGAIPEHLLESELFGHVRGAFTGADRDKKGLFRDCDGGTILLDEIGEMPHKMQAGLLRVLQEKVVRPVGGSAEEKVNTRVVAATHRNLADMVQQGAFREDLFYRLNVIEVRVPPLRERLEDVPLLIDHFLRLFAARYSREKTMVSRDALKLLIGYRWPGNVRQLENVLLNAWILSDGPELEERDFELPESVPQPIAPAGKRAAERIESTDAREEQEREQILEALGSCNWNRAKAAQIIGMPRRTFYRRLKKFGIQ